MSNGGRISRRTVPAWGFGTVVSSPFLEAMTPKLLAASTPGKAASPRRLAFLYVPNGAIMDDWTPSSEGAGFDLPAILEPMAPHRDQLLVLSELTCDKRGPTGTGPATMPARPRPS